MPFQRITVIVLFPPSILSCCKLLCFDAEIFFVAKGSIEAYSKDTQGLRVLEDRYQGKYLKLHLMILLEIFLQ
jgi:hypothetical protein